MQTRWVADNSLLPIGISCCLCCIWQWLNTLVNSLAACEFPDCWLVLYLWYRVMELCRKACHTSRTMVGRVWCTTLHNMQLAWLSTNVWSKHEHIQSSTIHSLCNCCICVTWCQLKQYCLAGFLVCYAVDANSGDSSIGCPIIVTDCIVS